VINKGAAMKKGDRDIQEAFNSMLRTDYIPINDAKKLAKLSEYYIDYFGYLPQIIDETDQLIVGRRGTGKTTLLYRALIECVNSWKFRNPSDAKQRTLGVYIDLSKCHSLSEQDDEAERNFEQIFATELYESLKAELIRNWPALNNNRSLIPDFFLKNKLDTNAVLEEIAGIIKSGIPRSTSKITKRKLSTDLAEEVSDTEEDKIDVDLKGPKGSVSAGRKKTTRDARRVDVEDEVTHRLMISDILRSLGQLREKAKISHIILLVDEFSALSENNQRKFTTLLRKILGNHNGVYVKLCAITDNYKLGSSIIVQRDIFEMCLDFDRYVELNDSVNSAFDSLGELAEKLVSGRLKAFAKMTPNMIFENPQQTWILLSKACIAIPRTIGIILKHAHQKSISQSKTKIRISDIEAGIRSASKAYLNQFDGVSGVIIPAYHADIQSKLVEFLNGQKKKGDPGTCFFLVKSQYEERLKYLNMFFLVHLITRSRTTKKEKTSRNLYMLDYGLCLQHNI
jgi:hypothetical protein